MNLWDQRTVRQVMTMFGLSFRKEFGQNFLTDPEVIDRRCLFSHGGLHGSGDRTGHRNADAIPCGTLQTGDCA